MFFCKRHQSNQHPGDYGIYITLKYSLIYVGTVPLILTAETFKQIKLSNKTKSAFIFEVPVAPENGMILVNLSKSTSIGI